MILEKIPRRRKCRTLSEEHKRKISLSEKGKILSEEHKKKISIANKGKKRSEESLRNMSEARKGLLVGEENPAWRGGRTITHGYILILKPKHPFRNKKGYVFEHRLVMEEFLGRELSLEEVVHHINGNISDNRIENIMLFANQSEHLKHHRKQKLCIQPA